MTNSETKKKRSSKSAGTAKKEWNRTYLSLSFSAPPEMEKPMNDRASSLGYRSRSEYICDLIEADLKKSGLLKAPVARPKLSRVGVGTRSNQSADPDNQ
jgi:hypothetical protein